jgi:VanZ family protein
VRAQAFLWGPVLVLMALIFFVSSLPAPPGARLLPDWETHTAAYAALAALLARALAGGVRRTAVATLVMAGALATVYGVTDEWHQMYVPERRSEVRDVVNDMIGAALGAALFGLVARLRPAAGAA